VTAFDVLVKKQVGLVKEQSLDYVRLVKELQEIPKLHREVGQVLKD
jgi:hypothetical protein